MLTRLSLFRVPAFTLSSWSKMVLALLAALPLVIAGAPRQLPDKMLGMYLSVADDTVPGYLFI